MRSKEQRKPNLGDGEPRNLWEEFGLPPPQYEDERYAPPVDKGALRALVEKRLPEAEVRELYRLTFRFRSWADALAELRVASISKVHQDGNDPPE